MYCSYCSYCSYHVSFVQSENRPRKTSSRKRLWRRASESQMVLLLCFSQKHRNHSSESPLGITSSKEHAWLVPYEGAAKCNAIQSSKAGHPLNLQHIPHGYPHKHSTQHTTHNTQRTMHNAQCTTHNTHNTQRTHNTQHTPHRRWGLLHLEFTIRPAGNSECSRGTGEKAGASKLVSFVIEFCSLARIGNQCAPCAK